MYNLYKKLEKLILHKTYFVIQNLHNVYSNSHFKVWLPPIFHEDTMASLLAKFKRLQRKYRPYKFHQFINLSCTISQTQYNTFSRTNDCSLRWLDDAWQRELAFNDPNNSFHFVSQFSFEVPRWQNVPSFPVTVSTAAVGNFVFKKIMQALCPTQVTLSVWSPARAWDHRLRE